ncbi:peptidoglycan-binding domain-containing protein [Tateyamaria sp. ANG-S1]|uniref:peptidoglycan-binding domain-containing protein n=1 Tax=Tateyamaria sp. ANG-S1 TaxID=1577905 RepID=UPI00057F8307|nr:peptidoglycan-binding domain-containing protein [Tateyamaria sp. ANG-S1]KIC50706.1 peptidoglycan-binding protein [Tateyamaria sp. ANG-S1]
MTSRPTFAVLAATLAVAGCADTSAVTSASNIDPISLATAPPGAAPGTCWGKSVSPAVIETVTRKILLQPAQISSDGRVQTPPIYKTETRQEVVQPRRETWYEVICEDDVTPDFIASVQRALEARGYYRGPITGEIDPATRAAIGRYQSAEGLESKALSIAAARKLGLVAVARDT